jgi:hypothetical protein
MRYFRNLSVIVFLTAILSFGSSARGAFHLWQISEVFSNSDGSVQFIELFTSSSLQTSTNGTQITSNSNTFTFPSNLAVDSANKHMLLATAGFSALAGVTPDFTIPAHFFNPGADSILYKFTLFPATTFSGGPTDGVKSLNYPGGIQSANSPTNLAGTVGSVPPPIVPTGDYNGNKVVDAADYTVWRDSLGNSVTTPGTAADGDKSGTIDNGDFTFWVSKFGNSVPGAGAGASAAGSVPEPGTVLLSIVGTSMFVAFGVAYRVFS